MSIEPQNRILPAVGDSRYRPLINGVVDNIKTRQSLILLKELLELVKFFQNKSGQNVPADRGTTSKAAENMICYIRMIFCHDIDLIHYKKKLEDDSLNKRRIESPLREPLEVRVRWDAIH